MKYLNSWKEFCPDYEIIEWNEDNFDITKNYYCKKFYGKKKWAFAADYARFDILYNE
jgi:mannosyltransferase OCH1-like enzyme